MSRAAGASATGHNDPNWWLDCSRVAALPFVKNGSKRSVCAEAIRGLALRARAAMSVEESNNELETCR